MSRRHHVLYRMYSDDDSLLYIGKTTDPGLRLRKHAENKIWWPGVASVTLEHFRTSDALERAERKAIAEGAPLFNVAHNPGRAAALENFRDAHDVDDGDPDDALDGLPAPGEDDWVLVEYAGPSRGLAS